MNIKNVVEKHGIENIVILAKCSPLRTVLGLVSYTSSNDEPVEMPCKIIEDRYKVADGYKVTLKPMYEGFAKDNYYQSDFNSMCNNGHIRVLTDVSLGCELLSVKE